MKTLNDIPWLNTLEPRERNMVVFGAVALLCLMLYVLAWEPLVKKTESLHRSNLKQEALVAWMQTASQEVKQLRRTSGATGQLAKGQSLLTAIDTTAKAARLNGAMKRVQPDGDNRVRVWLEGASFDDVMRWVHGLEQRQGVTAVNVTFEAKDESGRVDGRLTFETAQ